MLESQLVMEKLIRVLANTLVGSLSHFHTLPDKFNLVVHTDRRHFDFVIILHEYVLPSIRGLEKRMVLPISLVLQCTYLKAAENSCTIK